MHTAVTCEECFDLLDEFVELELAGADASVRLAGMRAHLEGCPACREYHDSLTYQCPAPRGSRSIAWTRLPLQAGQTWSCGECLAPILALCSSAGASYDARVRRDAAATPNP